VPTGALTFPLYISERPVVGAQATACLNEDLRRLPFAAGPDKSPASLHPSPLKGPTLHRSPWWLATLAAAIVTLADASIASADTYTVFSCKGPTGVANAALGWAASPAATGEGKAVNSCPNSGPLSAFLDAATPARGASASWSFAAPADTRIVRFAAQRRTAGVAPASNQSKDVSYVLDTESANLELCDVSVASSCVADLTDPIDK
jgi:hypothetical protein